MEYPVVVRYGSIKEVAVGSAKQSRIIAVLVVWKSAYVVVVVTVNTVAVDESNLEPLCFRAVFLLLLEFRIIALCHGYAADRKDAVKAGEPGCYPVFLYACGTAAAALSLCYLIDV